MKLFTIRVICSVCGKTLRGRPWINNSFHVSTHKNDATGRRCSGSDRIDHKEKGPTK